MGGAVDEAAERLARAVTAPVEVVEVPAAEWRRRLKRARQTARRR